MKKLITTCCIVGAFASASQAQIKLGLKLSPQITWVAPESKGITSGGSKINASYGLMFDYYFTENYAFATEISVANYAGELIVKDSKITHGGSAAAYQDVNYIYRTQYVSIPLMVRMRTNEIGYFRYYADFGLDLAMLVRARADISSTSVDLTEVNVNTPDKKDEYMIESNDNPSIKYNDDVAILRTAMVIGVGVQYKIFGNTLLVAGARYNKALNNFTVEDNWKAQMNAVSLNLGVLF
jgi:opacity protein-like surface antigen